MQIESRTCQACLGNYAEMQLCLFKEEKMGLVGQSSASIRLPHFFLFPLIEKGLSKKGKDRSDVSDFILKGVAFYAERFVGFAFVHRDSG